MAEGKYIPLDLLAEARSCLTDTPVIHSPLIPLNVEIPNKKIYLKCENLQPFRSFKARGACFAISKLETEKREAGICAASAGNFAQSLGYMAKQFNMPCEILAPDHIPETKLSKTLELGAKVSKVPVSDWWNALQTRGYSTMGNASFIHPCDINVMAGHGTIGMEIMEDLPKVDTVICPYGSGGLIIGVASAVKQVNPNVRVLACEPENAAPLKASLTAGKLVEFTEYRTSFVDGMGSKSVLPEAWPYVSQIVEGSVVVTLREVADSIRLLIDKHSLVTEGAGAGALAAAFSNEVPNGTIVCVLSGGNIDKDKLLTIFDGQVP
ncbi:L-threonine ammonia-lyase-like [Watersipora subatra]|uniref:L-threonine ammonia-lyase-like n=1 Tax=Watersipora subatra TaxID=2589382 RepID=UPI00355BEFE3